MYSMSLRPEWGNQADDLGGNDNNEWDRGEKDKHYSDQTAHKARGEKAKEEKKKPKGS